MNDFLEDSENKIKTALIGIILLFVIIFAVGACYFFFIFPS